MKTYDRLLDYLSAYNHHDINKIISFLHPDCCVIFNGQMVLRGAEAMRPTYEKDFQSSNAGVTLLEHSYENNDHHRIRALLRTTHDDRLIDVTYVFESNGNGVNITEKRMIEHLIHSVTITKNP
ncbi:hypothetical protein I4U23_015044 [Adineta vaga]|nr:hypothetical protein I4U23_015044 [Adineta vaga]